MEHRIVVYSSNEALPHERFLAYVIIPVISKGVQVGKERLPVVSTSATHGGARDKAEALWQADLDRERRRLEAAEKRGRALEAWRAGQRAGT